MKRLVSNLALIIALLIIGLLPGYSGRPVEAQGSHLILLWDGDTIPSGWTCISDDAGEDFYNRFPRGSDTYGAQGGSAQHAHDLDTLLNPDPYAVFCSNWHVATRTIADGGHNHDVNYDQTTGREGTNIPPYRSLKVIRCDTGGTPSSLPAGVIAVFHHDPPSGWTRYAAEDDLFVMGYSSITTGGSATHTHTLHVVTTYADSTREASWGEYPAISQDHYHIIDLTTYPASNIPPYLTVILAKADSDGAIPDGLVGMYDGTPTGDWSELSNQGGAYYNRFLEGSSVYGNTGGQSSHSHDIPKIAATSGPYGGETKWVLWESYSLGLASGLNHLHPRFWPAYNDDILYVHEAESLPPYTDVIVAQYNPTVPVVNTQDPTLVEEGAAMLNGEVVNIGAADIIERGFDWATDSGTPYSDNWTESGTFGTGSFSHDVNTLSAGTLYYYRAKAKNDFFDVWSYGAEYEFLTLPWAPLNFTPLAGDKKVDLSWTKGAGANRTMVRRSTTAFPTNITEGVQVYFGTGTDYLDTGLTNGVTYYYSAWSEVTQGTFQQYSEYYDDQQCTPEQAPAVTTLDATSVGGTTATLNGDITDIYGDPVYERGFDWDTDSGVPYSDNWTEFDSFGTGAFSHEITGLDKGTAYSFRAKARHNDGIWGWAEEFKFITKPDAPADFMATGGDGHIDLTWDQGEGATATLIKRSTDGYPQTPDDGNFVYFGDDTECTDSGLDSCTTYYYSAWSMASGDGLAIYSDDKATAETETYGQPVVNTDDATTILATSATMNGDVTQICNSNIAVRGFEWDTDSGVPYADNWTETGSFGAGSFSHNEVTLNPGTLYYYRAAAKNDALDIWSYGSEEIFLTRPAVPVNFTADAGDEKISLSWVKGTGADRTLVRRSTTGYPQTIDDGVQVYFGTGTAYLDTGLTNLVTYYYSAWSELTEDSLQQYSDTWAEISCTPDEAPTVETLEATLVEETTATLNGDITDIFGEPVYKRGFDWGTHSSVPYADNWTETDSFGVGNFSHEITGLDKGRVCYFRAVAQHDDGIWGWAEELKFITKPAPPSDLAAVAGEGQVDLSWNEGEGAASTLIKRSTSGYPQTPDEGDLAYFGTGSQYTDSGIPPCFTYYYSAWSVATGDDLSAYSDEKDTADAIVLGPPVVVTESASNVGDVSARLNGTLESLCLEPSIDVSFEWGTKQGGPYPNETRITAMNTTGDFRFDLVGLRPLTRYYFRAKGTGANGTGYGAEISFITGTPSGTHRVSPSQVGQLPPADVHLNNINISPGEAQVGQPVTVMANVVNDGATSGSYNVALRINGRVEQQRTIEVSPGTAYPVKFTVTRSEPGTYTVNIDDRQASFVVTRADGGAGTSTGQALFFVAAMAMIGLLLGLVIVLARRRFR
jgi:hypothetical protein